MADLCSWSFSTMISPLSIGENFTYWYVCLLDIGRGEGKYGLCPLLKFSVETFILKILRKRTKEEKMIEKTENYHLKVVL